MTGSPLAALPGFMTRAHKAQTVPPSSFFAALPLAGRFPFLGWRGIETESDFGRGVDSLIFESRNGIALNCFSRVAWAESALAK
jgi:hypothetical protein